MRVRIDLQKSVFTKAGSLRYATGELDGASGVLWLDEEQEGRRLPPGLGIHLASKTAVERVQEPERAVHVGPAGTKPARRMPPSGEAA